MTAEPAKTTVADLPGLKIVGTVPRTDLPAKAAAGPRKPLVAEPPARQATPVPLPGATPRPQPPAPVVDQQVEKAMRAARRTKRRAVGLSLALLVALPTATVGGYYAFLASDQYAAEARFAVRGSEKSSADLLGMISGTAAGSANVGDSYILQEYIGSRELVERLDRRIGLIARYQTASADSVARFGSDRPIEDFIDYWRGMVSAEFDHYSGIMTLTVKAFTAEDAQAIAQATVEEGRALVNRLSEQSRQDTVALALREVQFAEERLREARGAVTDFRNRESTVDPAGIAASHQRLIDELDGELVKAEAELDQIRTFVGPDAPSRRILETRIAALKERIAERRTLVAGTDGTPQADGTTAGETDGISGQIAAYQGLVLEEEFAQKAYLSAMASLETAKVEAKRDQRYLASFVSPSLPQTALYPLRFLNTLVVFAGSLLAWAISALLYAAVKDHMV